jgi:hypothetical protein
MGFMNHKKIAIKFANKKNIVIFAAYLSSFFILAKVE